MISRAHSASRTHAGIRADEESVQPQFLEKSDVPLQVIQPLIHQWIRRATTMDTVHDASDDELADLVRRLHCGV